MRESRFTIHVVIIATPAACLNDLRWVLSQIIQKRRRPVSIDYMNRITIAVLALVALAVIIILASTRSNNAVGQAKPPGGWTVVYSLPKTNGTNTFPKAR